MDKKRVAIIGAGIAGVSCALKLLDMGVQVSLLSLAPIRRGPSVVSGDCYNAVLNINEDSIDSHIEDTLKKGGFLAEQLPVVEMCTAGPYILNLLDRMGVLFHRTGEGNFLLKHSKHSSNKRSVTCFDSLSQQILFALEDQLNAWELSKDLLKYEYWHFDHFVISEKGDVVGIVITNMQSLRHEVIEADAVCICSGGYADIYDTKFSILSHHSGYPIMEALKNGACFQNPEFINFEDCKPSFSLGGLGVDGQHSVGIRGLFCAGEACSLYHGAELLQGNRVLADVYGGLQAGQSMLNFLKEFQSKNNNSSSFERALDVTQKEYKCLLQQMGHESVYHLRDELGFVMNEYVALQRDEGSLDFALKEVAHFKERMERIVLKDKLKWANAEIFNVYEIKNVLDLAEIIVKAAKKRKETRGMHIREDFPKKDSSLLKTTLVKQNSEGFEIGYEKVQTDLINPI